MRVEPLEPRRLLAGGSILFVRGASGSGGFLEGTDAASRDAQLADVNDTSTAAGNSGWGTLAKTLRDAGFTIQQMTEPRGTASAGGFADGRPIAFENLDLSGYDAIVFGSNNARYSNESADAIENYVRNGGGALFISDANFGSQWRDAPDSDQRFLARFGLIVNQDAADGTPTLSRAAGHFAQPDHPILNGVSSFVGEGVSYLTVMDNPPAGVNVSRVVAATKNVRNNDGVDPSNQYMGSLRGATAKDAALAVATAGAGRVAAFFDRNTFFNANGLGTDITEADNRTLALNLVNWVADKARPVVTSTNFQQGAPSVLTLTFDDHVRNLTRSDMLLRDPFTAEPIPRTRWGWSLDDAGDHDVLSIRVKGAQPPGTYQFQINKNKIQDDAGNPNGRIRANFTIAATGAAPVARVVPQAQQPLPLEDDPGRLLSEV
jgi:hypothetical protein